MVAALHHLPRLVALSGPEPEVSGSDDMYIPTTQIRIAPDGEWHRRGPTAEKTACGKTYLACAVRDYQLSLDMCPRCFTPHERSLALEQEIPVDETEEP
jgi:hypothetical protein